MDSLLMKLSSLHGRSSANSSTPPRVAWASSSSSSIRARLFFCGATSSLESLSDSASSSSSVELSPSIQKSRGEIFLESALSKQQRCPPPNLGMTPLAPETKKKKKKVKKQVVSTEPGCYGCGAALQTEDADDPGFVPMEIYEMKKKHHQLRTVLCGRCQALAHGEMIPAVGGHGGYAGGKRFVSAEQLRMALSHLRDEKALIINLVDIVDFNGSFLTRIRDLVGANPIILVATKIDLLPRGTNFTAIGDWILEMLNRKKLNVISVHLTSSKSMAGITGVVSYLRQQRQSRNVYILGSANVGKSAFVSAMLQELAKRDFSASAALRRLPIQSAMPGTTLGPIKIRAFSGDGSMFDTPGIHVHHRMAAVVAPNDLTFLAPRRQLHGQLVAPVIFSRSAHVSFGTIDDDLSGEESDPMDLLSNTLDAAPTEQTSLSGMSVLWGGIVRLDVVKAPPFVGFRFYGPSAISRETVRTLEADFFYKEQLGKKLIPPTSIEGWPGLESQHSVKLRFDSWDRPAGDIAVSGLGWVTIESGYAEYMEDVKDQSMEIGNEVHVVVHVPRSVEIFVRPSLPVGFRGGEWYDYRELSEKELEARPKVYFP